MQVLHQGGGAGSVTSTLHLSVGLARAGWTVRFVCPPGSEVEAQARQLRLEVRPLALRARERRRNAAALAELLAREPVDLVNSQSARDRNALAWLALTRRLRPAFVVTRRQMPRTMFLENWVTSRLAVRTVAVSRAVAEELIRRGAPRGKVVVVHNGVVTSRIDAPVAPAAVDRWRTRIGWEPGRRTIGIVSRRKDQHVVLRALDRVATPVRLVLAGVDPDGRLDSFLGRVPPRHDVVCLPFDPDIRPLYELLDLVLLPSRMEGLSQSVLEAMALGKPVAVSAAAGNLELVTDEMDGLLVPPLDPAAWATSIDRVLTDSTLAGRLGGTAARTARTRFTLARTVERTARVYCDILGCDPAGVGADSPPV